LRKIELEWVCLLYKRPRPGFNRGMGGYYHVEFFGWGKMLV